MIKRSILAKIKESIKLKPVTLITGARQVGKSTLCKMLVDELGFEYVSLDNTRELGTAKEDPAAFLKIHKAPLIIDEVQLCPELFVEIENIVNDKKYSGQDNVGMYVLTGSQIFNLMQGVTQSMAGRVSIVQVLPLSRREVLGVDDVPFSFEDRLQNSRLPLLDNDELFSLITRGFYPEIYDKNLSDVEQFYSDYVATYIQRDVSQLIALKDKLKYQRVMELLASLVCEEVVYDKIGSYVGVSVKTAQEWMSTLVASGIVTLLEPYFEESIVKRVVKRPKLLFNDTGLACYLSALNNPKVLSKSRFSGQFVENYIINEIIKSYNNTNSHARFYYYRDSSQNEIDLIILSNSQLTMVECKSGVKFSSSDIKAFDKLKDTKYQLSTSGILCQTDTPYLLKANSWAVPISEI